MPTYEYKCAACGRFEKVQPITADPLTECPTCGGKVERLISRNVNILFKGSGFHVTDYRSSGYTRDASAGESRGSDKSDGAAGASNGEAKGAAPSSPSSPSSGSTTATDSSSA